MNFNYTLKCESCDAITNVRHGLSNMDCQPVRFSCGSCGSIIDIDLGAEKNEFVGAEKVEPAADFLDSTINFIDLHLDFPIYVGPYVQGQTPFMRAIEKIGHDEMNLHRYRLGYLDEVENKIRDFKNLIRLFDKCRITPFKLNIKRVFDIELKSEKKEDIQAALYSMIARMMFPFEYPNQAVETIEEFMKTIISDMSNHREIFGEFTEIFGSEELLPGLRSTILGIYPRILEIEAPMRTALFLDFEDNYNQTPIALRVSTSDFETIKDLYKDIAEILSKQTTLVAGINNILKRGDYNLFKVRNSNAGRPIQPRDLNAFVDVSLAQKHDDIDDSWYDMLDGSLSNKLRNAIAHHSFDYDDTTQLIRCYKLSKSTGEKQFTEELYFIEFLRRILIVYREMHRLHHLIKSLYYYKYLILDKKEP